MFRSSVVTRLAAGARALSGVARASASPLFSMHPPLKAITSAISRVQPIQFLQPQPVQLQPVSSVLGALPTWPAFPAQEAEAEDNTIYMDSVLRKRRLKMKKHKLRKRRRNQRALKKRLGK